MAVSLHAFFEVAAEMASSSPEAIMVSGSVAGEPFEWRRVELLYEALPGEVVDLEVVRDTEARLKELPGWGSLCLQVPEDVRVLCAIGDSLAAAVFGSEEAPSWEQQQQSVLTQLRFDGQGSFPLDTGLVLGFLRVSDPLSVMRRLPADDCGGGTDCKAIRSTFAFKLPEAIAKQDWADFVDEQLAPLLQSLEEMGIPEETGEEAGRSASTRSSSVKLRVFYTVDGLEDTEFERGFPLTALNIIPVVVFGVTLGITARFVLSAVAAVLTYSLPWFASWMRAEVAGVGPVGTTEVPGVALVSWLVSAAVCAELAVCFARAHDSKLRAQELLDEGKAGDSTPSVWDVFLGKVTSSRTQLQALRWRLAAAAPTIGTGIGLLGIAGLPTKLALLEEFAQHAGLATCMLSAAAVVLFPMAMSVGDCWPACSLILDFAVALEANMNDYPRTSSVSSRSSVSAAVAASFAALRLYERLSLLQERTGLAARRAAEDCTDVLNTCISTLLAFLAVTCAIVAAASLAFNMEGAVAERPFAYFQTGHRIHDRRMVQEMFYPLPFPDGLTTPDVQALICAPEAPESAGCSWFRCRGPRWGATTTDMGEPGECSCYHYMAGSLTSGAARFFGLEDPTESWGDEFWPWLGSQLSVEIGHADSYPPPSKEPTILQMQHWSSGLQLQQSQASQAIPAGVNATPPAFEEADVQAFCFCDSYRCEDIEPPFVYTGRFSAAAGDGRRLQGDADLLLDSGGSSEVHRVNVVWGLQPSMGSPERPTMLWDHGFTLQDPWAQRDVIAMCEGTSPDLQIIFRVCWVADFRDWLLDAGEQFPSAADRFDEQLQNFVAAKSAAGAEDDYRYFWFDPASGEILGTYVAFDIGHVPAGDFEAAAGRWRSYVFARNGIAQSSANKAWAISTLDTVLSLEPERSRRAFGAVVIAMLCSVAFPVLCCVASPGAFMAVMFTLMSTAALAGAASVIIEGPEQGVMQLMLFSVFFVLLTGPASRVSFAYAEAFRGPPVIAAAARYWQLKKEEERESEESLARVSAAAVPSCPAVQPALQAQPLLQPPAQDAGSWDTGCGALGQWPPTFVPGCSTSKLSDLMRSESKETSKSAAAGNAAGAPGGGAAFGASISGRPSVRSRLRAAHEVGALLLQGPEGLWAERRERTVEAIARGGEAAFAVALVAGCSGFVIAVLCPAGIAFMGSAMCFTAIVVAPVVLLLLPSFLLVGMGETEVGVVAMVELGRHMRSPPVERSSEGGAAPLLPDAGGPTGIGASLSARSSSEMPPGGELARLAAEVLGWQWMLPGRQEPDAPKPHADLGRSPKYTE